MKFKILPVLQKLYRIYRSDGFNCSLQKRAKPSYLGEINRQNSIINIA